MSSVFQQVTINGMTIANRLVRSATWEGMCEADGRPTQKLTALYQDLALGGAGLIITGYTFVSPEGKQMGGKMGINNDDFAGQFESMTKAVGEAGGRIAVQLVHAGGQVAQDSTSLQPLAPSSVEVDQFPAVPAELTKGQIDRIIEDFGDSARRARAWGFDAVQLHGAHGYLINQFLSPLTNRRTDEYGGGIENRCRFALEVYHRVRVEVGPDFPVMIKLSGSDNLDGGLNAEDAIYCARQLSDAGIDAIEVSGGTSASGRLTPARTKIDTPEKEGYNLELASGIKNVVSCAVMAVGGFRSFDIVEKTVAKAGMDCISMSRPFIREPGLAARWRDGDRTRATCISCNGCFVPGLKEGGIYCVVERKEREGKG